MTIKINPPQFEKDDNEEVQLYKQRQFVEDVIRSLDEVNEALTFVSGGGGGSGGGGFPAQLGYIGYR